MKERAESRKKDRKHKNNTSAEEIFTPERQCKHQKIDTTLPAQNASYVIIWKKKR